MPIYEYLCSACNGRFSKLVRGFSEPEGLECPRCGAANVRRAVSRVAVVRSEEARLDSMADGAMFNGLDENDPASVARWAKKMGRELGEEAGDDWEAVVDQMLEDEMHGGPTDSGGSEDLGWG